MTINEAEEIFKSNNDFQKTVMESRIPAYVLFMHFLKRGLINKHSHIEFASESMKKGVAAEELFQKLVPKAVDINSNFKMNNPAYDFVYNGLTIDVKYSSFLTRNGNEYWSFRNSEADIIVAFLERKKGSELNNPYILFIPTRIIANKNFHITKNGNYFSSFRIPKGKCSEMLQYYATLKDMGMLSVAI